MTVMRASMDFFFFYWEAKSAFTWVQNEHIVIIDITCVYACVVERENKDELESWERRLSNIIRTPIHFINIDVYICSRY